MSQPEGQKRYMVAGWELYAAPFKLKTFFFD
jgi:hypothetical protein